MQPSRRSGRYCIFFSRVRVRAARASPVQAVEHPDKFTDLRGRLDRAEHTRPDRSQQLSEVVLAR